MEQWSNLFSVTFLVALLISGLRLAIPIYLAALGEIITERGGVLNLGLEGIMIVGALAGFMGAYYVEQGFTPLPVGLGPWVGILCGILAGAVMGGIMAVLAVTLHTDQVIASITLVILGQGVTTYVYRQQFSSLTARVTGFAELPIPYLADLPVIGPILFRHDLMTYLSIALLLVVWIFLYATNGGLKIRAVGEHPAAAETAGINVTKVRYAAVLIGAAFAGLGGAVLTVAQLGIFNEGITAGRGWIAVALVIFARWRPGLALVGALLFGLANALQFRIQALNIALIPYELLLMLPYLLTILVLLRTNSRAQAPAALGIPYAKE
ncbi:MAG: ABC transporter permease [Caldilineaceae bacterium]|nr:ABC transporter permease [Caldilineaceae bacterium]